MCGGSDFRCAGSEGYTSTRILFSFLHRLSQLLTSEAETDALAFALPGLLGLANRHLLDFTTVFGSLCARVNALDNLAGGLYGQVECVLDPKPNLSANR